MESWCYQNRLLNAIPRSNQLQFYVKSSIWHIFLTFFLTSILTFFRAFHLAYLWHSFWHLFRHSFWHYIIYQASTHSDILFGILSGTCLGARALKNASGAGEGWCSGPWSSGPTSTTQGGWVQSCCSWAWAIRFKRAPCWCQGLAFGMENVLFFSGGRWSENCGLTNQNGDFSRGSNGITMWYFTMKWSSGTQDSWYLKAIITGIWWWYQWVKQGFRHCSTVLSR